jgi:SAM-dependent methyltransferase
MPDLRRGGIMAAGWCPRDVGGSKSGGVPMARDVYCYINELDDATVRAIGDQLEFRGADASFTAMREAYFDRLPLPSARLVLAVGCGTGVEMRALARRAEFGGRVIGIDHSPALVEHGRRLAAQEGVADRLEFRMGDALLLDMPDARSTSSSRTRC